MAGFSPILLSPHCFKPLWNVPNILFPLDNPLFFFPSLLTSLLKREAKFSRKQLEGWGDRKGKEAQKGKKRTNLVLPPLGLES